MNPPSPLLPDSLYLLSSCFFLSGAAWALWREPTPINLLATLGSLFFLLAASLNLWRNRRPR